MIPKTLKILHHNVLAWTFNRRNELCNIYREINPDILLLSSHGQKNNNNIKIFGYNTHQNNPTDELNDGVAIAVRKGIQYELIDDLDEAYLAVKINTTLGPIVISTGYQPPRRPAIPLENFRKILRRNIPAYFIGDLNAQHRNLGYSRNNITGEMVQSIISNGIATHAGPDFATFITTRTSSTPDIILCNRNCIHQTLTTPGPITSSDHIPIIFDINSSPIATPSTPRYRYDKADWELFGNILQSKPDIDINNQPAETVNTATIEWMMQVTEAMDASIPKTSHRSAPTFRLPPELKRIQELYINLLNKNNNRNWSNIDRKIFKALQINLQNKFKEQRNKWWEDKIQETQASYQDPKQFWESIKRLMGNNTAPPTYLIGRNNEKIHGEKEKEQLFREMFSKIFKIGDIENQEFCQVNEARVTEYLQQHQDRYTPHGTIDLTRLNQNNRLIAPITLQELKTMIKHTKKKKAPGLSKINKIIMQKLTENMIQNLTHIYNAALSCGIFPDQYKKAILKLIPKAGKNQKIPENFRPISLLELTGKIFEKIINARLRPHLEQENGYHPNQHAYRKHRGTHTATALIYENIATAQERRNQTTVVLRDVSKAFDKVWHKGLFYKIIQLNLPRCFTALLCNFLENRTAAIQLDSFKGPDFNIHCGVPQGSVLSPTLYNIYTADLPTSERGINMVYADDATQIINHPGKSKNLMKIYTTREIEKINNYEKQWKIKTNQEKFKLIYMSKHNPPNITINNRQLHYSNNGKILGMHINTRGIRPHIKTRRDLAQNALNKIKRFSRLSTKTKLHLVKAMVLPHLLYPPTPLQATSKSNLEKLQAILNKSLRWANGDIPPYHTTMEQLHKQWKINPINTTLFTQNYNIWEKIRTLMPVEYELLNTERGPSHKWWPSSLLQEDANPPLPIYINTRHQRQAPEQLTEEEDEID